MTNVDALQVSNIYSLLSGVLQSPYAYYGAFNTADAPILKVDVSASTLVTSITLTGWVGAPRHWSRQKRRSLSPTAIARTPASPE